MTQLPEHPHFRNIRIVLVNTSHPGNIGATARAMKNMGLSRLYLVEPQDYPSLDAFSRAAGAIDILDNAVRVSSLGEAIGDCTWVAATSARLRTVEWPILTPEECVNHSLQYLDEGEVALVFGRENNGLTNEELEQCNALLHIPTNEAYSSLNIAAAVQVVCYEFRKIFMSQHKVVKQKGRKYQKDALASNAQLNGLYEHMRQTLDQLAFFGKNNPDVMMRRIRGMFNRMQATQREVAIMRGICSTVDKKVKDSPSDTA